MNTVEQVVTRLTQTLRENARASRGQSAQITQVNAVAVGRVAELTRRNAAFVEQSAASSTDLKQQTNVGATNI